MLDEIEAQCCVPERIALAVEIQGADVLVPMPVSSETVSKYHCHCQGREGRDANI